MDGLTKEYKALVRSSWRLFNLSHRAWSRAMDDLGLSSSTFPVVEMAVQQPGVTQQEIANTLSVDKSCISRAVKYLEEKGYLQREKCSLYAHGFRCYPTEKAREAYAQIYALEGKHISSLFEDVDPGLLAQTNTCLNQLIERLATQTAQEK